MARVYQKKSKLKQGNQREELEQDHTVSEHQGLHHAAVPVAYSNTPAIVPAAPTNPLQKKESEKKDGQVDSPYQYHVPRQFAAVPPVQRNSASANSSKVSTPASLPVVNSSKKAVDATYADNICFPDTTTKNLHEEARVEKLAKELGDLMFGSIVRTPNALMRFMGVHFDDIAEIDSIILRDHGLSIDQQLHMLFIGEKNANYILAESYFRNGKMSLAASLELACVGAGKIEEEIFRICELIGTNRQEVENELYNHYGKRSPALLPNGQKSSIAYMINDQHLGGREIGVKCKAYLAFGAVTPASELEAAFSYGGGGDIAAIDLFYKYGFDELKAQYQVDYAHSLHPIKFDRFTSYGYYSPYFRELKEGTLTAEDLLKNIILTNGVSERFWSVIKHIVQKGGTDFELVREHVMNMSSQLYTYIAGECSASEMDRLRSFFPADQTQIDKWNKLDWPFGITIPDTDDALIKLKQNNGYGKEKITQIICESAKADWLDYAIAYRTKATFRDHLVEHKVTDHLTLMMLFDPEITTRISVAAKLEKKDLVLAMLTKFGLSNEEKARLNADRSFWEYVQGSSPEQKKRKSDSRERWMSEHRREIDNGGDFIEEDERRMRLQHKEYKGFDKSSLSKIMIGLRRDHEGVAESRKGVDHERSGLGSALWEMGSDSGKLLEAYQIDSEVALEKAESDGAIDDAEHTEIKQLNDNTQRFKILYAENRDAFENRLMSVFQIGVSLALAPFTGGASLLEGLAIKEFGKMVITKSIADLVTKQLSQTIIRGDRAEAVFTTAGIGGSFVSSFCGSILKDVNGLVPTIGKNFIEDIPTSIITQIVEGKSLGDSIGIWFNNIPASLLQNAVQTTIFQHPTVIKSIEGYNRWIKSRLTTKPQSETAPIETKGQKLLTSGGDGSGGNEPPGHESTTGPKKPSDYEGGRLPPREELILNTLRRHGSWKTAISELSQSQSVLDQAFVQTLVQYREQMLIRLIGDKAKLAKGATNEPESDKDYSFFGEDAGANLIAFEHKMQNEYGENWDKIWRTNAYLDSSKLTNAGSFSQQEGGKEFVQSVNKNTELYNLAHLLRNSKGNAKAEQGVRQLIQSLSPDQRIEVERLAGLSRGERQSKKEELLKLSDQKEKAKGLLKSGSPEFIRAEREIALLQQELNYYTFEADIGPGSLLDDGSQSSKYQIVLNNLAKIRIIAQEYSGLGPAAREYMVFKDMNRIFAALRGTGLVLSDNLELWSHLAAEIGGKEVKADGTEVVGYRSLHLDANYIRRLTDTQLEDVTRSFEVGIFELLPRLQSQAAEGLMPVVDIAMPDPAIIK